jgi:ribosomal protein S18 acetylase RimI-like enzyme
MFRRTTSSPSSTSQSPLPTNDPNTDRSTQETKTRNIRIRKTVETDVPHIAEMLASAVVSERSTANDNNVTGGTAVPQTWRRRMDQMFAKKDIEALLRTRLVAIHKGQQAWKRVCSMYPKESIDNRLKVLWMTTPELPTLIEKASQQTGEPNVWQYHNFVLTPTNLNWLNHVQITAEDVTTGTVVGFCEVAMLSNPCAEEFDDDDGTCRVTTTTTTTDSTTNKSEEKQQLCFSPGITNLATSLEYRQQGIGTRLLQFTERFVSFHWKAEQLGLYVEKTNIPAMALYTKLGYQPKVTCDGGDILGDLWYMGKALTVNREEEDKVVTAEKNRRLVS